MNITPITLWIQLTHTNSLPLRNLAELLWAASEHHMHFDWQSILQVFNKFSKVLSINSQNDGGRVLAQ